MTKVMRKEAQHAPSNSLALSCTENPRPCLRLQGRGVPSALAFGVRPVTQVLVDVLENPLDGGAWWAAVYGVAQRRTRLKRRSSSRRAGAGATLGKKNQGPDGRQSSWSFLKSSLSDKGGLGVEPRDLLAENRMLVKSLGREQERQVSMS